MKEMTAHNLDFMNQRTWEHDKQVSYIQINTLPRISTSTEMFPTSRHLTSSKNLGELDRASKSWYPKSIQPSTKVMWIQGTIFEGDPDNVCGCWC